MKLLHLCLCFRSWECDQFWFPNNCWRIYSQSRKVGQRTKQHIKVNFLRTEICRLCVTSWQYQTKTEVFQKSDGATRSSADRNVIGAFSIVYMYMGGLIIFCCARTGASSATSEVWVRILDLASLVSWACYWCFSSWEFTDVPFTTKTDFCNFQFELML